MRKVPTFAQHGFVSGMGAKKPLLTTNNNRTFKSLIQPSFAYNGLIRSKKGNEKVNSILNWSSNTKNKVITHQKRCITESTDFKEGYTFTSQTSLELLHDPMCNKGTAFSRTERDRLFLRGLLPPAVKSMDIQVKRIAASYSQLTDDIDKYLFLVQLQDRNEVLFYRFVTENIKDVAPIIYTPTVGTACQEFGAIFRRPRGMYFSAEDKGEMHSMIYNYPIKDVDVIVVTDGGRVLGLGDLGANGMAISIGKLALYVAAGGIHPGRVLPIMLDVGTNNENYLNDPFYLGINRKRLTGKEYFEVVEEFMSAITTRWPNVLIQFEDFTPDKANKVLELYRERYCCFNDDIQGTGSVVVSGILNAMRIKGLQFKDIKDQKFVIAGAGSAGIGVADSLVMAMQQEGISEEEALKNFYLVDADGLITKRRVSEGKVTDYQLRYAMTRDDIPEGISLLETVKRAKPQVLLGISGVGQLFTPEILEEMAKHNSHPIIFPLSNPTSKSEATAHQVFKHTRGRAICATGSPFTPVSMELSHEEYQEFLREHHILKSTGGKDKDCSGEDTDTVRRTFYTSQGNNMFIFPGIGLASVVAGIKSISQSMFYAASKALANTVSYNDLEEYRVYPQVDNIRDVTMKVAHSVVLCALEEEQTTTLKKVKLSELETFIKNRMWDPRYSQLILDLHMASR